MGSFFGNQAIRLLRKVWPSPTMLAQELFAIFTGDDPLTTTAPVTLQGNGKVAPLTIDNPQGATSGIPAIQFTNAGKPAGALSFVGGSLVLQTSQGNDGSGNNPTVVAQAGGGGLPGKVVSGSASTYSVTVYPNWPSLSGPLTVTATQLQIAASEAIDANTWVVVNKIGTSYFMQSPVWGPAS